MSLSLSLCLLQSSASPLMGEMMHATILTGIFLAVLVTAMYFAFSAMRSAKNNSSTLALREQFEKSKDALLLAAQAKKAAQESGEAAKKQADAEERERELLRANVDPALVIGKTCPLCGLEMMEDQELVIDPYSGQGYHFSSFLSDWPKGQDRPKYVYRYPQGTVVKSANLFLTF
jgi:hypothetical protein